jgi:hypothetical protein
MILRKHALKFSVALLAFTSLSINIPSLAAQNNMGTMASGAPNEEAMQKMEQMSAALKLTPAQKKQVRPILMQEAPKLKEIKSNTSLGPMQKAMQMRQIADDTDAKLKPILTPPQYQTWEQMRAQERQQMMQKMENH